MSARHLDARLGRDGPEARFANTPEGILALAGFCRQGGAELVAMEATGGYERQPFALLWAEGVACALVNPRQVRRFAQGMGVLEKTDRIDAGLIAWLAEVRRVAPQRPAPARQAQLAALVLHLRQLTALRVQLANQRRLVAEPQVLASFEALAGVLAGQIRLLEAAIASLIDTDPLWAALDRAFRSIKGVAARTIARLMAELPEIGTLSGKAVAKLAGLAPLAHDSGQRQGRRTIRGGRASPRSVLFVVAEVVRRHDPDFARAHASLRAAGKPPKVVRVALARRLLVRLNAKARDVRASLAAAPA